MGGRNFCSYFFLINFANMQKQITILLVDDDDDDLHSFQSALDNIKITAECITAASGSEAIYKLSSDPAFLPEYIFLDLMMPAMDGKKCIGEIRKIKNNKHTPIIIHSSGDLKKDAAELIKTGASFYYQKPNTVDELTNILKKVLSAHVSKK